ncbi:VIR protein [Plasmodium vivax]|uniref:VIR protein n=1 Tax=Plasmodium vivax TaxID=5855 RepID=A0A1G4E3V2_PLAVI|nr:VIR protein [Plasmodium vivax]
MSEVITDIEKWEKEYPFLKNVWTTYKDFDEIVEEDKTSYDSLCNFILNGPSVELIKYKEKNKTTNYVVNKCFQEYTDNMEYVSNLQKCSKLSYEENIDEPIKITLLDIFDNNTEIIKNIMIGQDEESKTSCRKFVCNCLKIYKNMNKSYCHNEVSHREEPTGTCLKLKLFKESYKLFRYNKGVLIPKIPSLDDIDNECPENKSTAGLNMSLTLNQQGGPGHADIGGLPQITEGTDGSLGANIPISPESTDSTMKKNITTTVGTVAGASSLLAFLYRFTPAKNMIYSRFRGSRGRVHSNMYEDGHNELYNDHEVENFSSYNERYNIGYGSV